MSAGMQTKEGKFHAKGHVITWRVEFDVDEEAQYRKDKETALHESKLVEIENGVKNVNLGRHINTSILETSMKNINIGKHVVDFSMDNFKTGMGKDFLQSLLNIRKTLDSSISKTNSVLKTNTIPWNQRVWRESDDDYNLPHNVVLQSDAQQGGDEPLPGDRGGAPLDHDRLQPSS